MDDESYLIKEHYKDFIPDNKTINKIKSRINEIDKSLILNDIIKQDEQIFKIIYDNYKNTIDKVIVINKI